jgi:hypothetical protein
MEEALVLAKRKIIPDGYKPEDYYFVNVNAPLKIAKLIVDEAKFLFKLSSTIDLHKMQKRKTLFQILADELNEI